MSDYVWKAACSTFTGWGYPKNTLCTCGWELVDHLPLLVGRKDDTGKLEFSLLPWAATQQVVKVLMYGAKKYAPDNWRHVPNPQKRYFDAAMRHLIAWHGGEVNDPESGHPHLAHAACCLLFILETK